MRRLKQMELAEHCRRQSIPLTHQRRVVMDELARRSDHPTPDELYRAVASRIPGISRTTVYRCLEAFERGGLVTRVTTSDAVTRYDADTSQHPHAECIVCGRILDLPIGPNDGIRLQPPLPAGFTPCRESVVITGVCARCASAETAPLPAGDVIPPEKESES